MKDCLCEDRYDVGCRGGSHCFWLYRASNLTAEAFEKKYPQLVNKERNGGPAYLRTEEEQQQHCS